MTNPTKIPTELFDAMNTSNSAELQELGVKIGKLYTEHGLPVDMALDRLQMSKTNKLNVLIGVQSWFIQHRRESGASETALDRQRATNRNMTELFINTGETGVY